MPVTKSARKKLRKDKNREKVNNLLRKDLKTAISGAQKAKTAEKVRKAVSLVDKAVKNNFIHKNKAARIKSRLSKLAKPTKKVKTAVKPTPKKSKKK